MPVKLLRRILALLIVTAYLGATVLQAAPVYPASADMSSSSMNGMMHEHDRKPPHSGGWFRSQALISRQSDHARSWD
jgi:hypothetical protein